MKRFYFLSAREVLLVVGLLFFAPLILLAMASLFSDGVGEFFRENWGTIFRDLISLTGFAIGVWGLAATFHQATEARKQAGEARERASEAKTSAEAARDAAQEASKRVLSTVVRVDTVRTLESAITLGNRIYERQLSGDWERVPEFYRDLCDRLAEIQGEASALTLEEKDDILKAVSEFTRIEERIQRRSEFTRIEERIQRRSERPITPKQAAEMNTTLNRHRQKLTTIKTDMGRREEP